MFARLIAVAAILVVIGFAASANAAGALAVGKCGAFGHAFDYKDARAAMNAAKKQCKGDCKAVPMKNPCGAHGYAFASRISSVLNTATRNCYKFGGKECVIRTWACDARG